MLLITGVAKALSATGIARVLNTPDPLLGMRFRELMLFTGLLEVIIALLCLLPARPRLGLILLAWLSTMFVIYRVGLWLIGWEQPCHCMGTLTDALRITPTLADRIMKCVLAYLIASGYVCTMMLSHSSAKNIPQVR
jgi:hypothetical protein